MAVIELMEHITDPTKDQGEWIAKIDLVESGDNLLVEEQAQLGDCGVECKTVQRAAEEIVGDNDTDLAEELWKVLRRCIRPMHPPPPPPHPSLPPLALTCVPITSLPFANETDLALLWKVFQCCKGSCPGAPPPALQTPSPCCLSPADQSNPPFLVVVVNNGCACQACHSLDLHLLHTCCPR